MATDRPFVHLHCHSHYSLLDGASRIPELVERVKALGMNAVALTDHGNLYGAIEFYLAATAAGIKPIIGYEAYVAPGSRFDRDKKGMEEASFHLTLLAQNEEGFHNLIRLASAAYLEGFYYRPRIDKDLLAAHAKGLICLSGCPSSEFSTLILKEQMDEAERLARWYVQVFGDNFFVEIQNNGLEIQRRCAEGATEIARRLGLPVVATCDAHYLCQSDADAHDVLLCINTGKKRSDLNRIRYGSDQFYVRAPEEMYALFPDQPDAVRRSQEIADRCDLRLDLKKRHFPVYTPPEGKSAEEFLRELCLQGLRDRYGANPPAEARKRLDEELQVICRLGFASYFLIVWDFVRFARERGIPYGARGSACGALVSYVLKLSHVDPLEYDLLFERFLDPNRAEAPDIDIDFCQERREEVLQYVRQRYGEQSVAQIATFGTLLARAAIKDVGRVLGMELARVDQISKMIPKTPLGITLDQALQSNPDLRREYETDPQVKELIDIARRLEGTNRNAGTHAAGVVIANGPLTNYVPVQREARPGAPVTTQWTMEDLEKVGMLKMDFLGLRTLTLLDKAVKLIRQTRGVEIDLHRLPLDDAETFQLLQRGDTQGVFQFESSGIRDLLQRMKPDNIRDIIAVNALYRPGPLGGGMVDAYINRKHGREKPVYPHPVLEEVLAETYGVMCYQEQVMRILNRLGGIELSSAYACIKAISKKKQEVIDQRRAEFLAGAKKQGVSDETAAEIFDLITHFGGYGFNKSHSTAYGHLAYQTAYLKAHYPAEFMAALLTSEIGDSDKIAEHIENVRSLGLELVPPSVNLSDSDFTVVEGKVVVGLAAIRGLGRKAAEAIVQERREHGPYRDLFDLCARLDQRVVGRTAVEMLIKAGACDCFHRNRAALFASVTAALQAGNVVQEDRRHGQRNIFEMFSDNSAEAAPTSRGLPDVPDWSEQERLSHEKEALGFYVSSHPLARHREVLRRYSSHELAQLGDLPPNHEIVVGGIINGVRLIQARRSRSGNTRMARFVFADFSGSVDCVIFPDDYERCRSEVRDDNICFLKGSVDRTGEKPGLIVTHIYPLAQAPRELTRSVILKFISGVHQDFDLEAVARLLQRAKGRTPVYLQFQDPLGRRAYYRVSEAYYVDVARLPTDQLELLLGEGQVEFGGLSNGNGQSSR
ncbi:MAG: DNA polymerase III subunit alpha [Gemmatales bacterium]|nr:DNA polymerase III subunit alpha [Gemmatales bacterium]MDW8387684.1 DNA polymerase III subunit alpha [Gemmatales bacterium]